MFKIYHKLFCAESLRFSACSRVLSTLLLLLLFLTPARADEGMWLPMLIQKKIPQMQENVLGISVTPEVEAKTDKLWAMIQASDFRSVGIEKHGERQ